VSSGVRFAFSVSRTLPPLAWIAHITRGLVEVRCGSSVRCESAGFVEGTWVGPGELRAVAGSTTVFGSAVVADAESVVVVPPSHPCERLYLASLPAPDAGTLASNSLVALLVATGVELLPDVAYPSIFVAAANGVATPMEPIPTSGRPIVSAAYHNHRVHPDGSLTIERRPRERPFSSFEDYRDRLTAALSSLVANAAGYEMAVSISSGYDSTAAAAVAARCGCRRAVTFREGKPVRGSGTLEDSGAPAARHLGMAVESFDRLDYLGRRDLPEAEFLATGMTGEDVVASAMEDQLRRTLLITGSEAFPLKGNPLRPGLYRADLSACSLTEFRLRIDCIHLPILFFGASEVDSLMAIARSPAMRAWSMPGPYDKPIQRRLAEEAGIPRGSFASIKRRASARIHADGLAAMAPASVSSVGRFAQAEGRGVPSGTRKPFGRRHRFMLRLARALRMGRLMTPLERRRRALVHFEPALGALLVRWAVRIVSDRYAELGGDGWARTSARHGERQSELSTSERRT
jgi:hypothetical protein